MPYNYEIVDGDLYLYVDDYRYIFDKDKEEQIKNYHWLMNGVTLFSYKKRKMISAIKLLFPHKSNFKPRFKDGNRFNLKTNNIIIGNNYAITNNIINLYIEEKVILLDKENEIFMNYCTWGIDTKGYVRGNIKNKIVKLHRLVMNIKDSSILIDHINRDKLDNRKENLRIADFKINAINRIFKPKTSMYKGVYFHRIQKVWCAMIKINGIQKHLGNFKNEVDAAKAYDKKAKEVYGSIAFINFKQ